MEYGTKQKKKGAAKRKKKNVKKKFRQRGEGEPKQLAAADTHRCPDAEGQYTLQAK